MKLILKRDLYEKGSFQLIDNTGKDIAEHLIVKKLTIEAGGRCPTPSVVLELYIDEIEVEIEKEDIKKEVVK